MAVLNIKSLVKTFDDTEALKGISLKVEKGEIFGFLGPNGAGKSTTLRCIMDFIRPTSGKITVFGKDSTENSTELKKKIAYVPSEPNLYPNWTVNEHLSFVAKLQNADIQKARELQEKLQLAGSPKIQQLSTGNKQKLALVLALMTKPDLLLLDEPTRGLDPLLRSTLHKVLKEYQKDGGTILLSSHDLSEVEELCTNLAIIKDGVLAADNSLDELKSSRTHTVKAQFSSKVPALKNLDISDVTQTAKSINFSIKGDLNPLIKELAKHKLKELEINSASLEDIFMEIYN